MIEQRRLAAIVQVVVDLTGAVIRRR